MDYLTALATLHEKLEPAAYVEIGCRQGASLALARCQSIAVDPDFEIRFALEAPTRVFKQTSDGFFQSRDLTALLGGGFDLAFIDGMHKAEYALRDFINLERHAAPGAVIAIDDVLPQDMSWTTRERETNAWTGDVYKLIPLLARLRPDLRIDVIDIEMKGFALISTLDPNNTILADAYPDHEAYLTSAAAGLASVAEIREILAPRPADDLPGILTKLRLARTGGTRSPSEIYLDHLKRSLLNEIYLDDELRLLYMRDCLEGREAFDAAIYHDIRDARREAYAALQASREVGRFPERNIHRSGFSHTMIGRKRLDSLHDCLDLVRIDGILGDFVECGVWRGGACMFMTGYAHVHRLADRTVFVADSFEGLPVPNHELDRNLDLSKTDFPELAISVATVRENFEVAGLPLDNVQFLKGWFKDTLKNAPIKNIALLRLDGDLYESTMDTLNALYPKVSPGGVVIVDDHNGLPMCRQAVADYFEQSGYMPPEMVEIDWTGVWWRKA